MRKIPKNKYKGLPCSYVGTGCAFEDLTGERFTAPLPEGLADNGWATLRKLNSYVREHLPVKKQIYYKRTDRFKLRDFLKTNKGPAGVCVLGHFIYVNDDTYWSFFDNRNDDVVCVWYISA